MVYDLPVERRYRITYVFPPNKVFDEIRACYERAAAMIGDITVNPHLHMWGPANPEWNDPNHAIIFWCQLPYQQVPILRKAKCVFQYMESVGHPQDLTPDQNSYLSSNLARSLEPDLFIAGTPTVVDFWNRHGRRAALAPIGYDPEIMGVPDWHRPKLYDIGFCGSMTGRRMWIIPAVQKRFGSKFLVTDLFGRERNEAFNACRAMLYVGHSTERAFADLRLWSAMSTSAALITEDREAWPARRGLDFFAVNPAREENPDAFVDSLEAALLAPLPSFARNMNEHLAPYTVDFCIEKYTIPAIEAMG